MVDFNKPLKTRSGKRARVVATDCKHDTYPVIALVERTPGREEPHSYTRDGAYISVGEESGLDLVNGPEEHEVKVTFFRNNDGTLSPAFYMNGDRVGNFGVVAIQTVNVTVPA